MARVPWCASSHDRSRADKCTKYVESVSHEFFISSYDEDARLSWSSKMSFRRFLESQKIFIASQQDACVQCTSLRVTFLLLLFQLDARYFRALITSPTIGSHLGLLCGILLPNHRLDTPPSCLFQRRLTSSCLKQSAIKDPDLLDMCQGIGNLARRIDTHEVWLVWASSKSVYLFPRRCQCL